MIRLKNPIKLWPSSFTDDNGNIVKPEPLILQQLNISFTDMPYRRLYYVKVEGVPSNIILFNGDSYSKEASKYGGFLSTRSALIELDRLMGADPEKFLQGFFPKSLENHPNGAGTILSNFLKKIGITSTPTCKCRQRAIEMNEKGNDWCLQNVETIVEWLKEEADKREMIYQDWCIRALVNRSIKRAIKKCKNSTLAS